jgi:hypothetical protein
MAKMEQIKFLSSIEAQEGIITHQITDTESTIEIGTGDYGGDIHLRAYHGVEIHSGNDITLDPGYNGNTYITGNLNVSGDLAIHGKSIVSSLEEVVTPENTIILRKNATSSLSQNEYTGIVAEKYDGSNSGMLVFDKNGTAYVGDVIAQTDETGEIIGNDYSELQPLATRDLYNNDIIPKWDNENSTLVESNLKALNNGAIETTGNTATGINSFAIGNGTIASGDYSYAGGVEAKSNGNASFAYGQLVEANGEAATAIGYETYAYGRGAFAQGYNTAARLMGYYMTGSVEYDGTVHTLTLSDTQGDYDSGNIVGNQPLNGTVDYAVGDKVTIVNNLTYPRCGTITGINGNRISISGVEEAFGTPGKITITEETDTTTSFKIKGDFVFPNRSLIPALGHSDPEFNGTFVSNGITFKGMYCTEGLMDEDGDGTNDWVVSYLKLTGEWITVCCYNGFGVGGWIDDAYRYISFKEETTGWYNNMHTPHSSEYNGYLLNYMEPAPAKFAETSEANKQYFGASVYSLYVDEKPEIGVAHLTEYSHAEGYETEAIGYMSHAEGFKTKAIGKPSYAEGHSTRAIGDISHAEGYATEASGYVSHAEGSQTKASGKYSHSEGDQTEALGYGSHAEGTCINVEGTVHKTRTTEDASGAHAEGIGTLAAWAGAHSEGALTEALEAQAHAEGNKTIARAAQSHAEGWGTEAKGIASHAEGKDTVASGNYSHAEGGSIAAANGEVKGTTASGQEAHAEGVGTLAAGRAAHAEGALTQATANQSHAQGNATIASGSYSFAGGHNSSAEKECSFVFGEQCHSTKNYAFAFGKFAEAKGIGAVAFAGTNASGEKTVASGENSVAIGRNVSAVSNNSFALGWNSTATNGTDGKVKQNGIAIGYNCKTTASQCGAIGHSNEANFAYSFAFGYGNKTNAAGQFLVGTWAAPTASTVFAIGKGTSAAPKSIFEVSDTGTVSCSSIKVGDTLQIGNVIINAEQLQALLDVLTHNPALVSNTAITVNDANGDIELA